MPETATRRGPASVVRRGDRTRTVSTGRFLGWRLAAVALGLGITLLGGELAIRLVSPRDLRFFDSESFRTPSTAPGQVFDMIPGAHNDAYIGAPVRINALGLRDREILVPKPPGTVRILALGDSVTFGYGVTLEQTYVKRLERRLNDETSPGRRYEVVNGGVEGTSLAYYTRALATWAPGLEPDLVMIGVVLNDVERYVDLDTAPRDAVGLPPATPVRRAHGALLGHSQLYLASYLSLRSIAYRLGILDIRYVYGHSFLPLEPPSDLQTRAWTETLDVLDRMLALARSRGVRVALVLFPMEPQVSPAARDFFTQTLGLTLAPDALEGSPQRRLAAAAASRGVPVLDLLPVLRESNASSLYLQTGPIVHDPVHLSPLGHEITAAAIRRFLASLVS